MNHNRKISVLGLGYVGLPVAVTFAQHARVIGFDIDSRRISELEKGDNAIGEVSRSELGRADIVFTSDHHQLKEADFHIVAVPTPIYAAKYPDLSMVLAASDILAKVLKKNDIVIYESTVYPGATEEECIPHLESDSGLKAGKDFFVGYSPERINPGDTEHTFVKVKKVVSAQDPRTLSVVADVYGSVVKAGIHMAPSIKVAEAAKVIENTQRDLNISLMNELALIFEKLDIDTGDVLAAAETKWNFLPFKPGLVGGHCIGVDPYYLTYKAEASGYSPRVILAGRKINDGIGTFVAVQVVRSMIKAGYTVKGNVVSILGFTFKANIPDTRNTRVIDVIRELQEYGIEVQVHDPHADKQKVFEEYGIKLKSYSDMSSGHAVVLAVPHAEYVNDGWGIISGLLVDNSGIVFDVNRTLVRDSIPAGIQLIRL